MVLKTAKHEARESNWREKINSAIKEDDKEHPGRVKLILEYLKTCRKGATIHHISRQFDPAEREGMTDLIQKLHLIHAIYSDEDKREQEAKSEFHKHAQDAAVKIPNEFAHLAQGKKEKTRYFVDPKLISDFFSVSAVKARNEPSS